MSSLSAINRAIGHAATHTWNQLQNIGRRAYSKDFGISVGALVIGSITSAHMFKNSASYLPALKNSFSLLTQASGWRATAQAAQGCVRVLAPMGLSLSVGVWGGFFVLTGLFCTVYKLTTKDFRNPCLSCYVGAGFCKITESIRSLADRAISRFPKLQTALTAINRIITPLVARLLNAANLIALCSLPFAGTSTLLVSGSCVLFAYLIEKHQKRNWIMDMNEPQHAKNTLLHAHASPSFVAQASLSERLLWIAQQTPYSIGSCLALGFRLGQWHQEQIAWRDLPRKLFNSYFG